MGGCFRQNGIRSRRIRDELVRLVLVIFGVYEVIDVVETEEGGMRIAPEV